jgi:hypothetical protein
MKYKKKVLKEINKRKLSKIRDCLWNIYNQFGYNIEDKKFKDNPKNPLYQNCFWTEKQELEMIKAMKKRKIICYCKKRDIRKKAYNCHGCGGVFYFPTTRYKK